MSYVLYVFPEQIIRWEDRQQHFVCADVPLARRAGGCSTAAAIWTSMESPRHNLLALRGWESLGNISTYLPYTGDHHVF